LLQRVKLLGIIANSIMQLASFNCVLCSLNAEETAEHLECDMAKACWKLIGLTVNTSLDPFQIFESFKMQLTVSFFTEIIIIMSWSIWAIRNDVIFRGIPVSSMRCLDEFKSTFGMLLRRTKKKYFPAIESWIEQVV
jgi:hypothetical protein